MCEWVMIVAETAPDEWAYRLDQTDWACFEFIDRRSTPRIQRKEVDSGLPFEIEATKWFDVRIERKRKKNSNKTSEWRLQRPGQQKPLERLVITTIGQCQCSFRCGSSRPTHQPFPHLDHSRRLIDSRFNAHCHPLQATATAQRNYLIKKCGTHTRTQSREHTQTHSHAFTNNTIDNLLSRDAVWCRNATMRIV